MTQELRKPLPTVALLLACYPFFLIFSLHLFAMYTYALVGHWPSYNNPDPKSVGWGFEDLSLQLASLVSPFVLLLTVHFAFSARSFSEKFPLRTMLVVTAVNWPLSFVYWRCDPAGVSEGDIRRSTL